MARLGGLVNDDEFEQNNTPPAPDDEYEKPAVFDFGYAFTVTRGSSGGTADSNGQGED
jgi:hypothetical protein